MERRIVSVSQINAYIKNAFDSDFLLQNIWIKGEISNFKLHYSGHMYMSLKDADGVIRAVMFKGAGASLRFVPENGMQVLARGRISVYPRDGAYQLYIEEMEPEGAGALYIAFEQLKNKLEKEGLFDPARKKALPRYPGCIGVITSATGAALRDIMNIINRRWRLSDVTVYPVLVQGEGAAAEIAAAVSYFNREKAADVLIVGRGGGSQEDLWAFNEEIVARAVADSHIPVISAVGHETDFTICDFVSDLRAPTPSAAAELVVPDETEIRAMLSGVEKRLSAHLSMSASKSREKVNSVSTRLSNYKRQVEDLEYELDSLTSSLAQVMQTVLEKEQNKLMQNAGKLDVMSPLKVLSRGFTYTTKSGEAVASVSMLETGDEIAVRFHDGLADCVVKDTERSESI